MREIKTKDELEKALETIFKSVLEDLRFIRKRSELHLKTVATLESLRKISENQFPFDAWHYRIEYLIEEFPKFIERTANTWKELKEASQGIAEVDRQIAFKQTLLSYQVDIKTEFDFFNDQADAFIQIVESTDLNPDQKIDYLQDLSTIRGTTFKGQLKTWHWLYTK